MIFFYINQCVGKCRSVVKGGITRIRNLSVTRDSAQRHTLDAKARYFVLTLFVSILSLFLISCASNNFYADTSSEWKFAFMSYNKSPQETSAVYCTNVEAVSRLAGDMAEQGVSLVIVGGDMIDGRGQDLVGLDAQYAKWLGAMSAVYNARIPVYAVPGNQEHWCDTNASCLQAWRNDGAASSLPARG